MGEDDWQIMFDLAEDDVENWVLIGGQMVYLLAAANGVPPIRATNDVDVAVNVRARPKATEWLAGWPVEKGFALESGLSTNAARRGRDALDFLIG